jgi:hypothetical protein
MWLDLPVIRFEKGIQNGAWNNEHGKILDERF